MAISGFGKGISLLAFPQDGAVGEVLTVTVAAPDFEFEWEPGGGVGPSATDWLEFVAQAANPGSVPAVTLYMDDGTNFDANTVAMGDLTIPMILTSNVGFGDPGTEQGGINVQGVTFDAITKINQIGGANEGMLIMHRHSDTFAANLSFSRSRGETAAHVAVQAGDTLSSQVHLGWSGTHYDIAAFINVDVPLGTTISPTSLAGEMSFFTTPDLSNTSLLALRLGSDQSVQMSGAYTFPTADGALDQVLTTDGAGQLSFGDPAAQVVTTMFLSGLLSTILNLTQTAGASPISVDLAPILGLQRLQIAYASDPTPPQITINATPDALTIDASVAGAIFEVRDLVDASLISMATTGSSITGGSNTSNLLTLQGSTAANRGSININGNTAVDFDWTTDVGAYAIRWANTIPVSGAGVVGLLQVANVVNINASTFISSTVDDNSLLEWDVTPGFAVQTLFFARPTYQSTTVGIPPSQSFIYAAQAQYRLTGAGAVTVGTYRGLSFTPIIRVDNAGDDLSITNTVGMTVGPAYNTLNATAVADYGTIRGVHMLNAVTILFGSSLGSEIADNWIGLEVEALTGLVVSGVRVAVRSAIPAAASNFVIQNIGGAQSDFGAGAIHLNDDTSLALGNTIAAPDAEVQWLPANNALDLSGGRIGVRGTVEYLPIVPTALVAGNNNDWDGLLTDSFSANMRYWARVSGNASGSDITGIDATAVQDGDTFELTNVSANTIRLMHQDTNSAAANRIINQNSQNFVLKPEGTVVIRYDSTTSRWRVTTQPGAVLPLESEYRFDTNITMADPGSGDFRNNNATLASVTAIAISDISFKGGDASNVLSGLASGDQLYIQNKSAGDQFMVFDITSTVDNTTWWQINGTVNSSGAAFSNNGTFGIVFIFA